MDAKEQVRRGAVLLRVAREHLTRTLAPPASSERSAPDEPPSLDDPPMPGERPSNPGHEPWLHAPGAVFVTLRNHGQLRGCVGSLQAVRPLLEDVLHNVVAAAIHDDRFPRVEASELDGLTLEITLLSPPQPISFTSEADALDRLRPGEDGVVLTYGSHRATFLPQVWESLTTPEAFVTELKRKAGLADDFWHADLKLERYRVKKWSEAGSDLPEGELGTSATF